MQPNYDVDKVIIRFEFDNLLNYHHTIKAMNKAYSQGLQHHHLECGQKVPCFKLLINYHLK
jgi:nitrate reductase beta subunit